MDEQHAFERINLTTFNTLLQQYPKVVPEKLEGLERQRLTVIPQAIKERDPSYITKDELVVLMDWKLAHGKFRPSLRKLIQQNDEPTVKTTSMESFKEYSSIPSKPPSEARVKRMIEMFSKLRGVGPATATLLVALCDPVNIPFFSDELYRWAFWDAPATAKGSGWKREIKYTLKEYLQLYPKVHQLKARLASESGKEISALDVEKVAYVLGKQADPPPAAAAKGKKRKSPAQNSDDESSLGNNPAWAAYARNFEVAILGEERVAELDREEAEETAAEREEREAFAKTPYMRGLAAAFERGFGGKGSDSERDDDAESTVSKKRKKQKERSKEGD
ncbi:hypothetical protein LTR85_011597 [Meristemomyces frigidus]|nr:hypothetical protein LTR85_011597 [Meristemomyces frigidus]